MTAELIRTLISVSAFLAFVAIAGFGAVSLRGRSFDWSTRASRRLVLKNRLTLGDRSFVALIQLDDTELLLGSSVNGVTLLLERPTGAEHRVPAVTTSPEGMTP